MMYMSLRIQEQVPLAPKTTLKCGGAAEYYAEVSDVGELTEAMAFSREHQCAVTLLGGGSNVLVSSAGVRGLVIHPQFLETTYEERGSDVFVYAGAGVTLDMLVGETVSKHMWGLENLSGIPGSVGAVPIQNVGAYGVEAKDVVHEVHTYNRATRAVEVFSNEACAFAYRHSFFKTEAGKQYVIIGVTFKLSLLPAPRVSYKDLALKFEGVENPELNEIRDVVLAIRRGKFPDWHSVGTAGSFFKNPIVSTDAYALLQAAFPGVPGYREGEGVKIPLGWILDHVLHVKGYREGNVGLYEKQALVLVRYDDATSDDIIEFAKKICDRVFDATGVRVEFETVYLL